MYMIKRASELATCILKWGVLYVQLCSSCYLHICLAYQVHMFVSASSPFARCKNRTFSSACHHSIKLVSPSPPLSLSHQTQLKELNAYCSGCRFKVGMLHLSPAVRQILHPMRGLPVRNDWHNGARSACMHRCMPPRYVRIIIIR